LNITVDVREHHDFQNHYRPNFLAAMCACSHIRMLYQGGPKHYSAAVLSRDSFRCSVVVTVYVVAPAVVPFKIASAGWLALALLDDPIDARLDHPLPRRLSESVRILRPVLMPDQQRKRCDDTQGRLRVLSDCAQNVADVYHSTGQLMSGCELP
jgi:hypothetical protein